MLSGRGKYIKVGRKEQSTASRLCTPLRLLPISNIPMRESKIADGRSVQMRNQFRYVKFNHIKHYSICSIVRHKLNSHQHARSYSNLAPQNGLHLITYNCESVGEGGSDVVSRMVAGKTLLSLWMRECECERVLIRILHCININVFIYHSGFLIPTGPSTSVSPAPTPSHRSTKPWVADLCPAWPPLGVKKDW